MSVCDPQGGMHELYQGFLPEHLFADAPQCRPQDEWQEEDIADFARHWQSTNMKSLPLVLEPIVQGAGGMRFIIRTICAGSESCAMNMKSC